MNLSLSSSIGLVPSHRYSSITPTVPFLAQASKIFMNRVALGVSVMNGHSVSREDSGFGAWHRKPSNSFVQLDDAPKIYSSGEVSSSLMDMNPSRFTSKPSSSGSKSASLAFSGSNISQTYLFSSLSKPPIFSHICASKPSGIPSPSVSDTLGSRYHLSPDSLITPVSPLVNPGSTHSAG